MGIKHSTINQLQEIEETKSSTLLTKLTVHFAIKYIRCQLNYLSIQLTIR